MKDGKDTIIVLPQFQIDGMVEIMDYILTHPATSVGKVKARFNLNEDEYHMIYDLCMPHLRHLNKTKYWIVKYKGICCALEEAIGHAKKKNLKTITVKKLDNIMARHGIGVKNKENWEALESCDISEEPKEEEDE